MADFDTELTALFRQEADPALGQRLADAALLQIDHEDRRRRLVLGLGGLGGLVAAAAILDGSGALRALLGLAAAAQHITTVPLLWPAAAVALAIYAAATIRAARSA